MTHDGDLVRVRDDHGYDCGWTTTCACGWSGDLRERHGQALGDLLDHLQPTRPRPKDGTDGTV